MITNKKKELARRRAERSLPPLTPEEQSEWDQLRQYREKAIKESGAKLAEHLMAFNDGVIAIIITIVVLEIAAPLSKSAYQDFFSQILIYLISFFVVANFWYEIHHAFSFHIMQAGKMTMVCDFAFLASLSLIPVMTKWIMGDLSVLSVVSYGVVYFLVQIFELATEMVGMRSSLPHIKTYRKIWGRLSWLRFLWLLLLNLAFILISFVNPRLGMILYLAFPIINFVTPDNRGQRARKGDKKS
ncbi:membrane protein [Lactobacillus nasalidis]|uniref:Membrane protein n=1 Tax=Lactobacillus nasalidis TaxID=2797258 RepID=A0ABQ3W6M0_9LACO|nr:TMEM175 family protein [Lactobacillus nasalidis]GHV97807.1 membrane protein [Lactobacillus nasalidis]GHV99762.1 membrane protein [Lactobacillus nasalidis]GHW02206.1 membrane protein [Lactobacillus nasalidis]